MLALTPYLLKQQRGWGPYGNESLGIRSKVQTCPRHWLVVSVLVGTRGYSLTSGSDTRLQTYWLPVYSHSS